MLSEVELGASTTKVKLILSWIDRGAILREAIISSCCFVVHCSQPLNRFSLYRVLRTSKLLAMCRELYRIRVDATSGSLMTGMCLCTRVTLSRLLSRIGW